MKNLSLIMNGVLLVAVIVLFYLHFSGSAPAGNSERKGTATSGVTDARIAFVVSDSILANYEYLKTKKAELEKKTAKMEQEYRNRAQGLQDEITNYQRIVNNLTLSQTRAMEEDLTKKQQNLRLYEQSLSQELMNEEAKLNKELYDRVTAFLKEYGQANDLHVVLKYDPTSDLLYAGDALDITSDVITGLNEAYSKEGTEVKADTVKKK